MVAETSFFSRLAFGSTNEVQRLGKLPQNPGVYIFKKGKEILYIGKAANLRDRVKQHLLERSEGREMNAVQPTKQPRRLFNLDSIGYYLTGSEIEALLLEAQLIKKYRPKYNVLWKDDKNYFFVAITREKLPRVFIVHQTKLYPKPYTLNPVYVGPFVDGHALKQTLRYLRKIFPYYTTKKHPKIKCPWCHLDLCPGPDPDHGEYRRNIKNLLKVLKGEKKSALKGLKREMAKASKTQDFEKAAKVRNQIFSLEKVLANAKVLQPSYYSYRIIDSQGRIEGYDVSNIQGKFATGAMVTFIDGRSDKNFYRRFKIKIGEKPNDIAMLKEVLNRRFQHKEWPFPDLILVDGGKAQFNAAQLITKKYKLKTKIIALTKDKRHKGYQVFVSSKKEPVKLTSLPHEQRNLILLIDDEAHRFAVSYHRKLRKVDLLGKFR